MRRDEGDQTGPRAHVDEVAAGVRRITAPNPGPMTGDGTNSYLVGIDPVTVIDPGPDDPRHLAALRAAIGTARVAAILVTHAHRDHSALASALAEAVGAPVLAFGPPEAGRRPVMVRLAATGDIGGGEGVDTGFRPDATLADGEAAPGTDLVALHTPGHFAGHLSFALGDLVFSGDHVMAWSTTLISPPDGDLAAFLTSCRRLRDRRPARLLPGHGPPVDDPAARIDALVAHRADRERQIRAALAAGPATPSDLAARVYADINPALLPAAARNVLAHLIDLCERGAAVAHPAIAADAVFAPA